MYNGVKGYNSILRVRKTNPETKFLIVFEAGVLVIWWTCRKINCAVCAVSYWWLSVRGLSIPVTRVNGLSGSRVWSLQVEIGGEEWRRPMVCLMRTCEEDILQDNAPKKQEKCCFDLEQLSHCCGCLLCCVQCAEFIRQKINTKGFFRSL